MKQSNHKHWSTSLSSFAAFVEDHDLPKCSLQILWTILPASNLSLIHQRVYTSHEHLRLGYIIWLYLRNQGYMEFCNRIQKVYGVCLHIPPLHPCTWGNQFEILSTHQLYFQNSSNTIGLIYSAKSLVWFQPLLQLQVI